jgi:hypothetical protein
MGEDGGVNLYGFIQNNAINAIDPKGLTWKKWCGSGKTGKWVPEYPFRRCCKKHDECYGCKGKSQGKDKSDCDDGFYRCMLFRCFYSPNPLDRKTCVLAATAYYAAVIKYGGPFFNKARRNCGGLCYIP